MLIISQEIHKICIHTTLLSMKKCIKACIFGRYIRFGMLLTYPMELK